MGVPLRKMRWLRALLVPILALSPFTAALAAPRAATAGATPSGAVTVSAVDSGQAPAEVDYGLQAELAEGGKQTFLVKLKGDADVNGAAAKAQSRAVNQAKTPAKQRLARAQAVIESLHGVADKSQAGVASLLDRLKASGSVDEYERFWVVNAIAVTGDAKALEALAMRPEVEKITPSQTFHVMGGWDGAAGAASAEAASTGGETQSIEWNIARINAPAAWGLGIDGTGIVVANLDTGVDGSHPALARKWRGADGSDPIYSWFDAVNNRNSFPYDDHDHGTHTMGTIVGSDESGTNQIGVAPGARWISAKILNANGSGTDVDILEAGQWILAPGGDPSKAPDVVSNSWGGGPGMDEWFRPTVAAWRAAGIVPVFANGNDGPGAGTVASPGNYPESIGVGATDNNDMVAGFSSRGPSPYGETKPEISAPGAGIRSAVPGGGYEGGWSGTSMATPHVAGVAALLLQANASLTPDDIEQIMTATATPRTDSQYTTVPNNGYGYGIVNAFDAVSSVLTGRGTIAGRVVTSGDDLEPAVITHTPVTSGYAGFDVPVQAQVSDNVSVTEVSLLARMAGEPYYTVIPMTRTAGDFKSGTYAASIPGYLVQVPATEYYIRAVDYGNSPATTPVTAVSVSRGLEPGYFTDMETEPAGFSHGGTNDPWQWGAPTSGPGSAHSGSKVYATNLTGNYVNGTNAYLATPPIYLGDTSQAALQFWQWYDFENNYDYGDVWVIDAAGNQTRLLHQTSASGGWRKQTIDLTPWAGQSILVLFNMTSDSSNVRAGWYLDDIALIAPDAIAPAAPAGLTGNADPLGSVALTWNAGTEADLSAYRIYRSATSGGGYSLLGTTSATAYTDGGAPSGVPSYYVVTAVDLWGNESAYSNEFTITPQGPTVLFFDNMEGGENGWTHGGTQDQWQLGMPTSGPNAAYSGASVWATNLSGNYNNSANAWLVSPPIALTGVSGASLQFAHWYSFESSYDFGYVEISANGGATWTQLGSRFTGAITAYAKPTFDLTPYVGQTVQIRFRMTSDGSVVRPGWYIDDVKVLGTMQTTVDGAWAPTKPEQKEVETAPEFVAPKPADKGDYPQEIPGTTGGIGIESLPMDATVTILETGRSVRTNPANGAYTMNHAAGSYTARAEAYGYFPVDAPVEIVADGTLTQNFLLEPIPTGIVSGVVTDARTGAPIEGAIVSQAEDARVPAVTTGPDGSYTLTLLQGTYNLKVAAQNYKSFTAKVTVPGNGAIAQDAALEPFIGFPGELAYDDGSAENAHAFYDSGNGWAVRMSPDPAKGTALLQSASFFTWDTTWPTPGGTAFQVAVYDASGADGGPGQRMAGPVNATAVRGQWTTVDLSRFGLSFNQDFYVVYIQAGAYPNVPGLGTDETGPNAQRSWQMVAGSWTPSPADEGNYMIRAGVKYELAAPVITSPLNGWATADPNLTVEGTAQQGSTVNLYLDGALAGSAAVADGTFSIPVTLHDGKNQLTATAAVAEGETRPSPAVWVILDQKAPTLTVDAPADGLVTNRETVTVTGTAGDTNLVGVKVNGQYATMNAGAFSQRIMLNEGANLITVIATDAAGNTTTVERNVTLDTAAPAISGVTPDTDVTLKEGETMTVAFDSEPGLQAGFQIVLTGNGANSGTPNMQETAPGHYEGTYTAPANTAFTGATVQVWAMDAAANRTTVNAAGRLTVEGTVANQPPVAVIVAPTGARYGKQVKFDGSKSTDPDGRIVKYEWDFGDGTKAEGMLASHVYAKQKGSMTYTVTLTVTDDQGATSTTTVQVTVK